MQNANPNWCNLLSGVVTPDLVQLLAKASELAESQGSLRLASDLRDWQAKLSFALEITDEPSNRPEIWLG
jgi:hypothetical protein